MTELLPLTIQPILDRLAAELTTSSLILLLALGWSGFIGHRKTRRIDELTDKVFDLSREQLSTSAELDKTVGENTRAINSVLDLARHQRGPDA